MRRDLPWVVWCHQVGYKIPYSLLSLHRQPASTGEHCPRPLAICILSHMLNSLKQYLFIISQFLNQNFKYCLFGYLLRISQVWNQGFSQTTTSSELQVLFEVYSNCWQNSAPWRCKTEVPIFLLAVGQGSLLATRGSLRFYPFRTRQLAYSKPESPVLHYQESQKERRK